MPSNLSMKSGKVEEKSRKLTPSQSEGESLFSSENPCSSETSSQAGQDVMDIDTNEGRRKRRKTVSPLRETSGAPTGESASQPRRSGRESAAVFYGFVPPMEEHTITTDPNDRTESSAAVPRKVGRPKKKPAIIVIDDEMESGSGLGLSADAPGINQGSLLHSNMPDAHIQDRPRKLLKFNPKTGTIGSPPAKKAAAVKEKGTKTKKRDTKIVTIHYGSDYSLPASIGQRIDQILDGSTTIPIRIKAPTPQKPVKVAAKPLKNLHPLFAGKSAIKQKQEITQKPAPKKSSIIDLTGPIIPKEQFVVRPNTNNFIGFGAPTKKVKIPGALEPA